jgi:hypothetical protein
MRPRLTYHHVGIPTDTPHDGEIYLPRFGMHVVPYDTNPFGIEWLRFEPGSPIPELVQQVPHVAFVVDNLDAALSGREVLIEPNRPSDGVTVAFIVDNGAPVEFLQYD